MEGDRTVFITSKTLLYCVRLQLQVYKLFLSLDCQPSEDRIQVLLSFASLFHILCYYIEGVQNKFVLNKPLLID